MNNEIVAGSALMSTLVATIFLGIATLQTTSAVAEEPVAVVEVVDSEIEIEYVISISEIDGNQWGFSE